MITSPEWSGIEAHGRRYAPFTINVERDKPWHTLSGRQHFYLDHAWMLELGEGLPVYRPPLAYAQIYGDQGSGRRDRRELTLSFLTPHSKWSIHSEYQDNLHMLTLFRGGSMLWIRARTPRRSTSTTTTGSRPTTATGSWCCAPPSRTGCRRECAWSTTRRTGT